MKKWTSKKYIEKESQAVKTTDYQFFRFPTLVCRLDIEMLADKIRLKNR